MLLGTILSQSERLEIVRWDARGEKVSDIATNLYRSRFVVQRFLQDSEAYKRKRHWKQRELSDRDMRAAGRVIHQKLPASIYGGQYIKHWSCCLDMRRFSRPAYSCNLRTYGNVWLELSTEECVDMIRYLFLWRQ